MTGKNGLPSPPRNVRTSPGPSNVGGVRSQSTGSRDSKAYLHSGRIVHVDTETMVCSIAFDSMRGERHDIPIPAPGGSGPRSWAGVIPEVGTKVILGWKKFDQNGNHVPYIIEFLSPGVFPAREYEPFSSVAPEDAAEVLRNYPEYEDDPHANFGVIRLKARKGYPGDFISSSSSGSDFILDRDALLTNRAGNEFRIRDSDQTAILNVRNEFVSNAAGYYRRGLVKRSAFNFLPDLFPIDPDTGSPYGVINPGDPAGGLDDNGDPLDRSPAYEILHDFGLIKDDGSPNFVVSTSPILLKQLESGGQISEFYKGSEEIPAVPYYPYVVHPDGQRASYTVQGSSTFGFGDTPVAYTEDRFEMRMTDDGVMKVTDETDGFQIDPPYPVFIEDVRGTVVGNDFHTASGRSQYGRILGMKIFNNSKDKKLADRPELEPIDTVTRLGDIDFTSLARLFVIRHPTTNNQYTFGVTKEGRVMLHVPAAQHGEADDVGRSIDLNVVGMLKAIIGASPNHEYKSVDLKLDGGVEIEIGRFASDPTIEDNSNAKGGESIKLILHGGIDTIVHGSPNTGLASSRTLNGSVLENIVGSYMQIAGGSIVNESGAELAQKGQKITNNAGPGGYSLSCSGDTVEVVLGGAQGQYAKECKYTYSLGRTTTVISSVDSTTVLAGTASRTVVAGSMTDKVTTGNMTHQVTAGSYSSSVSVGSWSASCAAGSMSMTASGGPLSMTSSVSVSVTAGASFLVTAPTTKIGIVPVGFAVAGIPGPPGPHIDFLTGLPILGIPTIAIGV